MKKIFDYKNMVPILLAVGMLSMSYPYGFPLFGVLAILFTLILIFTQKVRIKFSIAILFFAIIAFLYFLGVIISGGIIYNHVVSDTLEIASLFFVWIVISSMNEEDWPIIFDRSSRLVIITGTIIALLGLHKFYLLISGIELPRYTVSGVYPDGTSLVRDRNMFGMALLLPLLMSIHKLKRSKSFLPIILSLSSILIISSTLFLTGSRRTWIALTIISILFALILFSYTKYILKNIKPILYYLTFFLLIIIPLTLIVLALPSQLTFLAQEQFDKFSYRFSTLKITESTELTSPRTDRWEYALDYFNQQPLLNQLFGSGFEYLSMYAEQFGTLHEGFPHNPILSALLYSGILGAILLISFYVLVTIKIFYNSNYISLPLLYFYILTYLYTMVSSNSIFSNTLFLLVTFILIAQTNINQKKVRFLSI